MKTEVATAHAVVVRKLYDAFLQGDIPYILNQLADNCEWNVMGAPAVPYAGKYIGKGIGHFFTQLNEMVEFTTFDVQNIYEVNETDVIATGEIVEKYRKSGKTAASPWMMLWRFQDGKVIYFQDYYDTAKSALAAQ